MPKLANLLNDFDKEALNSINDAVKSLEADKEKEEIVETESVEATEPEVVTETVEAEPVEAEIASVEPEQAEAEKEVEAEKEEATEEVEKSIEAKDVEDTEKSTDKKDEESDEDEEKESDEDKESKPKDKKEKADKEEKTEKSVEPNLDALENTMKSFMSEVTATITELAGIVNNVLKVSANSIEVNKSLAEQLADKADVAKSVDVPVSALEEADDAEIVEKSVDAVVKSVQVDKDEVAKSVDGVTETEAAVDVVVPEVAEEAVEEPVAEPEFTEEDAKLQRDAFLTKFKSELDNGKLSRTKQYDLRIAFGHYASGEASQADLNLLDSFMEQ